MSTFRQLFLIVFLLGFFGVNAFATNTLSGREPARVAASSSLADARLEKYKSLVTWINGVHDHPSFKRTDELLIDQLSSANVLKDFAKARCGFDVATPNIPQPKLIKCNELFKDFFTSTLEKKYFAAERAKVENRCKVKELACTDPHLLEEQVRLVHNSSIEASREQKLHKLSEWKSGKLSTSELESALNLKLEQEPFLSPPPQVALKN